MSSNAVDMLVALASPVGPKRPDASCQTKPSPPPTILCPSTRRAIDAAPSISLALSGMATANANLASLRTRLPPPLHSHQLHFQAAACFPRPPSTAKATIISITPRAESKQPMLTMHCIDPLCAILVPMLPTHSILLATGMRIQAHPQRTPLLALDGPISTNVPDPLQGLLLPYRPPRLPSQLEQHLHRVQSLRPPLLRTRRPPTLTTAWLFSSTTLDPI